MNRIIILSLAILYCTFYIVGQNIQYNKNYQIACHNCYEPKYAENIEDIFKFTTTIEIDIWDNDFASGYIGDLIKSNKMNRDWYVKHAIYQQGNLNCCGGGFSNCLKKIKNWSNNNPSHNVITIFIDKKENWSNTDESRKPSDLDSLLVSIFTLKNIYTPSMLLQKEINLKSAIKLHNWPILDSLKNKFIFVITNGTELTPRNPLIEYLISQNEKAICFIAPEIKGIDEIIKPHGFSEGNSQNTVFYNLHFINNNLSVKVSEINCLNRVYGLPVPETKSMIHYLIKNKVNFIALYNYKIGL